MSNGLTADWDLMQAISVSTVNTAIAAELKAASGKFPTGFSVTFTDPTAGATVALSGSFSGWSIQSGTGQNITFQASLTFAAANITEGGQTRPIPLTPYQGYSLFALITIDQLYYQQAQANSQALQVVPKTRVLSAQVMGMPTAGANSGSAAAPQPISVIDYANGDHLQDAFTSWCQNSLPSELAYAFLVMNEAQLAFAWATPTTASYSVNFPTGAGDGVFAQYSMTENRSSDNPYPVVQSNAVPGGSNGVLCISTDRFLQKVMINALAQQFLNASASDFQAITEPGSTMATGLTNSGTLTLPDMQLDNGDSVTATIPARGVSLNVVGNQIVIELDGLTFECPDILGIIPSGVHVTLNYSCTANLVLSNGALSLANVTHNLSYSVTFATVYTVLNVVIGVLTVVFALLGLAGTIQAARAAATQAAQAAQVTTSNAVNSVGGSIEMTTVSLTNAVPAELIQSIGDLSAIQRSGSELSEGEVAELRTMINDIGGAAGTVRSVSCGYITRIMGRLLLLAVAGYGAYRYVSFNLTGSFVQILEDGNPVDPPTLEDFSSELLKPVTWTNVDQNWSVNGAALNDGVQIDLAFASSPAPAPVST